MSIYLLDMLGNILALCSSTLGAGTLIGAVPVNSGTNEAGGDLGGEILLCATAATCRKLRRTFSATRVSRSGRNPIGVHRAWKASRCHRAALFVGSHYVGPSTESHTAKGSSHRTLILAGYSCCRWCLTVCFARRTLKMWKSITRSNLLSFKFKFIRAFALGSTLLFLARTGAAQFQPASTPVANPANTRFQGVQEDWNSPALSSSHLVPVRPLAGFASDEPRYTVELLQLQWRSGDPIDLYVMKPKGIKKPPVILYLYGYPTDTDVFRNDAYEDLVTRDGFAAVGFVSALTGHRYHDRPMKQWFLSELQESLATSAHDVQMVLNYLAARGDLDMDRV